MVTGWLLFLIILAIDIGIYAMITAYFDGTWDRIHNLTSRLGNDS